MITSRTPWRTAAVAVLLAGCTPTSGSTSTANACTPGDSKSCTCTTGATGAQRCKEDGSAYAECVCTPPASSSSGAHSSSSSGPDPSSAGASSSAETTSSSVAASSSSGNISLCGSLPPGFACQPFNPALVPAGGTDCTTELVNQFIVDCWAATTATQETCSAWTPGGAYGDAPCGQCLGRWTTTQGYPDTAGCNYLYLGGTDPTQQGLCRNAYQCGSACGDAACNANVCDDTAADAMGNTELDRCYQSDALFGSNGTCNTLVSDGAPVGTTATACVQDATFRSATANCRITSSRPIPVDTQIEYFYRGACRDNAVWTGADAP